MGWNFGELHQPLRLAHWHRPQHHQVHQAEDRGVGANAQRQRQHGRAGEHRTAPEYAESVAAIAHEVFDPAAPAFVAALFFHLLGPAESKLGTTARFHGIDALRFPILGVLVDVVARVSRSRSLSSRRRFRHRFSHDITLSSAVASLSANRYLVILHISRGYVERSRCIEASLKTASLRSGRSTFVATNRLPYRKMPCLFNANVLVILFATIWHFNC